MDSNNYLLISGIH